MRNPTSDLTRAVGRRPVRAHDLPFLRELFADSREDLLLTPDTRDVVVDQQFRAHRRQLLDDHPRARHEVVLLGAEPVGRVSVDQDARTVRVVDLAVSSERRGRGIGSAVLAGIVTQADEIGLDVRLLSWSGEHGVRRFYLNRGFTIATSPDGRSADGRSADGRDDLVRVRPPSATARNSAPTAANHTS